MTAVLVLCDPSLLLPPAKEDIDAGTRFWVRLVEWADDRRVRLGPAGQEFLVTTLAEAGWPDFEPPACPAALKRAASQAMNRLIGQVRYAALDLSAATPSFDPAYVRDVAAGEALGRDVAALGVEGLAGVATDAAHWSEPASAVKVVPPPPDMVPLVLNPGEEMPGERDRATAQQLCDRRIVVIGGIPGAALVETLEARFAVSGGQVQWVGSEKNQRVRLDLVDGLRPDRDLVFCIDPR